MSTKGLNSLFDAVFIVFFISRFNDVIFSVVGDVHIHSETPIVSFNLEVYKLSLLKVLIEIRNRMCAYNIIVYART